MSSAFLPDHGVENQNRTLVPPAASDALGSERTSDGFCRANFSEKASNGGSADLAAVRCGRANFRSRESTGIKNGRFRL